MKKRILSVAMSLTFVVLCFAGLAFSGAALTPTLPTNWNNTWSSPDVTISADDNGTKAVFGGTIGSSDKGVEYKTGLTGSWTVAGGLEFPSGSGVDPRFSITFRNTSGKLVFTLQSNATDDLYWKLTLEANNAVSIAGSDDRPAFNLATDDSPYNDGGWLKAPDRTNKYSWQISHQTGTTVLALNIMAEDGTVITSQLIQTNVSFFTGTANSGFWGAALTWGVQTEDKNTGVARNLQADTVYTAPADVTPYITTTASDTTDTTGATDTDTTDTDAGATDTTAAGGATTTEAIVDKPTTAGDWTLNGVTAATLSGQFAGQFARSTAGTMTYAGPTQIAGKDLYFSFDIKYNGEDAQVESTAIWMGNGDITVSGAATDGVFTRIQYSTSNGQFYMKSQLFKATNWNNMTWSDANSKYDAWTDVATATVTGTMHVVFTYTAGTDKLHLVATMGGATVYNGDLSVAGLGAAMSTATTLMIMNESQSKATVGNSFVLNAPPRTGGSNQTGQTLPIAIVALCALSASAVGVVVLRARKQRDDA